MFGTGYIALFLASFLAATVVPFSSDLIFTGMLFAGFNPMFCLISASIGNWLGGMSSYGLGYLSKEQWVEKYLRIEKQKIERFKARIKGKEAWIALLCWVPFIGDVIAVALGFLRTNIWLTSLGMLIGKVGRYIVEMWMVGMIVC